MRAFGAVESRPRTDLESARNTRFRSLAFRGALMYQTPMNDNTIENLASRLADAVPAGIKTMRDDLEKNFQSVLRAGIGKLDLVTREEFDVQRAVLARTREKLEALEEKLAELETAGD
jgi:BMFP domain-containing protein YqiC